MDPFTMMLISMGLQAGGTMLNNKAGQRADGLRSGFLAAERERQEALRREAEATFGETLAGFDAPTQQTGTARLALSRGADIEANTGEALAGLPGVASAPESTRQNGAGMLARALAEGRDYGSRLARMGAHSENQFNNQIDLNDSRSELGRIADFAAGSASALPTEIGYAQSTGQSPLGDALMGFGQVAGTAGALGMSPDWSSFFGPAAASAPPGFSGPVGANNLGRMI